MLQIIKYFLNFLLKHILFIMAYTVDISYKYVLIYLINIDI